MQPETMRAMLRRFGLSTRTFAALTDIDDRRIRRMLSGAVPVDHDVAALLYMIAVWRKGRQEKGPGG